MRSARRRARSFAPLALAGLVAGTAACLPRGAPPAGRQIVAGQNARLASVLPASPDGTLRVVVARPRPQTAVADLTLVSAPADGSPPTESPIIEDIEWGPACNFLPCFPADARGRLLVRDASDPRTGQMRLTRVDPLTGARLDLGDANGYSLSPDRTRLLVSAYPDTTLYEVDDRSTVITATGYGGPQFVGEDLYYVDAQMALTRIVPGGSPEVVRPNTLGVSWTPTDPGPLLVVGIPDEATGLIASLVVDPATMEPLFPPVDRDTIVSPDRRWLCTRPQDDATNQRFLLVEAGTGAMEEFDTPAQAYTPQWRPHRSELWLPAGGYGDPPATWIKRPGEPLVTLPVTASSRSGSLFDDAGTWWYSLEPGSATGRTSMFVAPADDPTAPRVRLNPDGSDIVRPRELADGRFLVEAFYGDIDRADISVVDPRTGDSRLLGREGNVVRAGDHRALAMLHVADGVGDVVVLDYDGGSALTLASEFGVRAVAERGGSDPLGPGTRLVIGFQARFDSPYDGIWVATLP